MSGSPAPGFGFDGEHLAQLARKDVAMHLVTEDKPRSNGPRRRVADGRPQLVNDTRSPRVLGSLDGLVGHLTALAPVRNHDWSDEHYEQAQKWYDAVLEIAPRYTQTAAREAGEWIKAALLDLYHQDCAEQAACYVPERPAPQRYKEIPQSISRNGRTYDLQASLFRWTQDTPGMATNRLATISAKAMPDSWLLVTYVERQRSTTYDPLIYARYGDWYVKVAEWL